MSILSNANLADAPDHEILENSSTYDIVGYSYAIEEVPCGTFDLTLEKNNSRCTLRFSGVCELEIDAGFPHSYMGLEILNVKYLGWENIHVRVEGFESEAPGIRFWASTVCRLA
jgi:hypothetical protein